MNKQSFTSIYLNRCFDKSTLKGLVRWSLVTKGENFTILLLEKLKTLGYSYATKAGISLSLDDLMIPATKKDFLNQAQSSIEKTKFQYDRGNLTVVERFQHLMDTWHLTSERLKTEVVNNFVTTNTLNPVYMMAFSGARGNLSQVRQLVGMRGLMSDPQGQIINFPIQSNFREGLTVTEYVISCYGARKGLVDTALRTANSGYLTRRLVDVAQHVIVSQIDCETKEGLALTDMIEANKTILTLEQRLIGRVLSEDYLPISTKNTEITPLLAEKLGKNFNSVNVRSPLTCEAKQGVCQLCYGWSLANGRTVALGEAVGVIAAQSIGEPGTQLTMRTFHTGGVFSGESMEQIFASTAGKLVYESTIPGVLIRTSHGKIAFLTRESGTGYISTKEKNNKVYISFPPFSILFLRNGENVEKGSLVAEFSSISKQANERIQAKQILTSDLEGQVWFEKVVLGIKNNREGKLTKLAHNYGSLWILAGKVIPVTFGGTLGILTGDKLTKNASLNESILTVPENGYLFQNSKTRKSLVNKLGCFLIRNTRFNNGSYWFRKEQNFLRLHDCLESNNNFVVDSSHSSPFSWYPFLEKNIYNSVNISSFVSNLLVPSKKNTFIEDISSVELSTSRDLTHKREDDFLNKLKQNLLFEKFNEYGFVIPSVDTSFSMSEKFEKPFFKKNEVIDIYFNKQGQAKELFSVKTGFVQRWKTVDTTNASEATDVSNSFEQTTKATYLRLTAGWIYCPNKSYFSLSSVQNGFILEKNTYFAFSKSLQKNLFLKSSNSSNLSYLDISFNQTKGINHRTITIQNSDSFTEEKVGKFVNKSPNYSSLKVKNWKQKEIIWAGGDPNFSALESWLWKKVKVSKNSSSGIIFNKTVSNTKKVVEEKSRRVFFEKPIHITDIRKKRSNYQKSILLNKYSKNTSETLNIGSLQTFFEKNHFSKIKSTANFFVNTQNTKTFIIEDLKQTKLKLNLLHPNNLNRSSSANQSLVLLNWEIPNKNNFNSPILKRYSVTENTDAGLMTNIFFGKELQFSEKNQKMLVKGKTPSSLILNKNQPLTKTRQTIQNDGEIIWLTKPSHDNKENSNKNLAVKPTFKEQTNVEEMNNQKLLILHREHLRQFNLSDETKLINSLTLGKIVRIGDVVAKAQTMTPKSAFIGFPLSGQIFHIGLNKLNYSNQNTDLTITLREANSVLFSSQGVFSIDQYDLVTRGTSLLTLFYQRLKTGDIVQGIPKIEEFFEARQTKQGEYLADNLHEQLQTLFFKYQRSYPLAIAVRKSFQDLQNVIVKGVQGVYQSQGVTISDKHLEIIVRQMTSIVRVINGGSLGLLPGELVHLDSIELFNRGIQGQTAEYEPIILGITKASLETKSFISAASFQETTRILTRAAVAKKIDFLRGLKESVILGHLIPAGTGFFHNPLERR